VNRGGHRLSVWVDRRTGGGIFLSPLLLFMGWSATKPASGVAIVFILCNSIAGLAGNLAIVKALPPDLPIYAGAVLLGAIVGTTLGIRFSSPMILKALGLVLAIAGLKLVGVYWQTLPSIDEIQCPKWVDVVEKVAAENL
jgi:uncharacterized membrane protein YfcA